MMLRPFHLRDIPDLVKYANERGIWLNLLDQFPHPYTEKDAQEWIDLCHNIPEGEKRWNLALEKEGELIGTIGWRALADVRGCCAELGYWLALPFRGKGLMTETLEAVIPHIFAEPTFIRIEAEVFGWNLASMKVLEKCGFTCEAIRRQAVVKDGKVTDLHCYALLRVEFEARH